MSRITIMLCAVLTLATAIRADENNLAITLDQLIYQNHLSGPDYRQEDLKGKVVMVEFWGIRCAPCLKAMPQLNKMYDELRDFGMVLIAPHAQEGSPHQVKSKVTAFSMAFSVYGVGTIQEENRFRFIPHTVLFDHTGKCIYRGHPTEIEAKLRVAVGRALVARTGLKQFTKTIQPYAEALAAGQSPYLVLARLLPLQKGTDRQTMDQAKLFVSSMTGDVQATVEKARNSWESDPMHAYDDLSRVALYFKGTPVATQANQALGKLKTEKTVQLELKARPYLAQVKQLDALLCNEIKGDVLPTATEFKVAYGQQMLQMKNIITAMKKNWPDAKATEQAIQIAGYYSIEPGK